MALPALWAIVSWRKPQHPVPLGRKVFPVSPRPASFTGCTSENELPSTCHHAMVISQVSLPAAGAGSMAPQRADKPAPTALQGVVLRRQSPENHFQMPPSVPLALLRVDAAAAAKAAPTGQRAGLSFQALQENKRLEVINS